METKFNCLFSVTPPLGVIHSAGAAAYLTHKFPPFTFSNNKFVAINVLNFNVASFAFIPTIDVLEDIRVYPVVQLEERQKQATPEEKLITRCQNSACTRGVPNVHPGRNTSCSTKITRT